MEKEFKTLRQVGKIYGFNHVSLKRMAQRGKLPGAFKAAGRWRVDWAILQAAWKA